MGNCHGKSHRKHNNISEFITGSTHKQQTRYPQQWKVAMIKAIETQQLSPYVEIH
jgi:hypothetical protein